MPKTPSREPSMALYEAILQLKDLDECYRFFQDLCSITEMRSLEQRYDVAALLYQGRVYTDILDKTGASSATISRVNRALNYSANGFLDVFARVLPPQDEGKDGDA